MGNYLYKLYFLTWVMFLTWRNKKVPKWMQDAANEVLEPEELLPPIEKYVK